MNNSKTKKIKPIAYYLPQFHPTPENDKWWGPGFTEWTNVAQATPIFQGHDQPRVPGLLGYYDLRLKDTIEQQIALAQRHSIYGFCIYYYWFSGKRILSKPLDVFSEIDTEFKFSICWANESWSRRWDGSEHEVLIKQEHDPEIDKNFILDVLPLLRKKNYIEYEGGKLITIYRPSLLNKIGEVIAHWRKIADQEGIKLKILGCETFGQEDWAKRGLDGSVEFPPHNTKTQPEVVEALESSPRSPTIYSYKKYVEDQISRPLKTYKCLPGVMTGWDNSPRRKKGANIFVKSSPALFGALLQDGVKRALYGLDDSAYVFINAWNEWAEGAYLEPDKRNGLLYLETVRDVVNCHEYSKMFEDLNIEEDLLISREVLTALKAEVSCIRLERDAFKRIAPVANPVADLGPIKNVPESISGLETLRDGLAVIDSVNDVQLNGQHALRASGVIKISGWMINPIEMDIKESGLIIFALLDKFSDRRYVWFRKIGRHERPDVRDAYSSIDAKLALMSGFSTFLDVGAVFSGVYDFYIGSIANSKVNFGLAAEDLVIEQHEA